jgi:hypothetical protein
MPEGKPRALRFLTDRRSPTRATFFDRRSHLGQLAQVAFGSPQAIMVTSRLLLGAKQGYSRLSPANKAKVDAIMTQAAEYLVNAALGDVLGWTRSQAVTLGLSTDAATVAEIGVRRIAEVGVSKAFEELRR